MRAEFIKIKAAGSYQGQVLPKSQLDSMDKRFQELAAKQPVAARRMEFDEMKFRLLAFIVIAEHKLKGWTVKHGYQPKVEEMLTDYNVSLSYNLLLLTCAKVR